MIPMNFHLLVMTFSKPRASGDDPNINLIATIRHQ